MKVQTEKQQKLGNKNEYFKWKTYEISHEKTWFPTGKSQERNVISSNCSTK